MQDRYVGDIGDFAKYGLLRAIGKGKRLGVAWYYRVESDVPRSGSDGVGVGDGRHTGYLNKPEEWRHLDPDLFDVLRELVDGKRRSVAEIEKSGILGSADFARDRLDDTGIAVRDRKNWRQAWLAAVQHKLSACDLVFADPDNGLYPLDPDKWFNPARKENTKRIPLDEARKLAEGRAAVIYHHNTMAPGGHLKEISNWMNRLPGCTYAWYWRRVSNRTFFILNPDSELERLLNDFASRWHRCGVLLPSARERSFANAPATGSRRVGKINQERILDKLVRQYDRPIMNNVSRGNYVECMVACALGTGWQLTWEKGWDWASYDCEHIEKGTKLEIKHSAAKQSWDRKGKLPHRRTVFDIAPRTGYWSKDGATWIPRPGRVANIYVFAWHGRRDGQADQRDPAQWRFLVVSERDLPVGQKSIGLAKLEEIAFPCCIGELRHAVEQFL